MSKARTDGKHIHKCARPEGCSAVWEHGNDCARMGEEFFKQAHTCPRCGFIQEDVHKIKGYHGTDGIAQVNVEHPVKCPAGPRESSGAPWELLSLLAMLDLLNGPQEASN